MKRSFVSLYVAISAAALPFVCMAQTETPAGAAGEKKLAVSSSDKQLVKSAGEAQVGMLHLAEVGKGQGSETVKEISKKVAGDINDSWGELDAAIKGKGAELPKSDQTAGEKRDIAELKKAPAAKFDKLFLKALEREAKHAATAFATGAKSASDADLKTYFAKWQPKVAALSEEISKAESEAGKKK
jgi:predicted outer membrane protein